MKNRSYQQSSQPPTSSSSSPSPATTIARSSSSKRTRNSKLDHIVQNFYTKTAQLIIQARSITSDGNEHYFDSHRQDSKKLNKWFNITTEDIGSLRDELKYWRTRATQSVDTEPPPMIIDIYLDTSRLTQKQRLVVMEDISVRNKVNLIPSQTDATYGVKQIVIESWLLTLNHPLPDHPVDLPSLYKRSIIFFRSLYSLVRLLPSHSLYRYLYNLNDIRDISIGYQFRARNIQRHDEIPLKSSILNQDTRKNIKTCILNDVTTPLGTFKLHVNYRRHCNFRVEDFDNKGTLFVDTEEHLLAPTNEQYRPSYRPSTIRQRPYSMYDTRVSILAEMAQGKDLQKILPKSSFSTGNRPLHPTAKSSDPREVVQQHHHLSTPPNRDLKPLTAGHVTSASGSPIARPISSPAFSPFKSPSLSSSPQAESLSSGFKNASPKSINDSQISNSSSFGRKVEFSSSFEKYKGSPSRTDAGGTPGKWVRHSAIDKPVDSNLEEFIRLVGGTNDLKLFQDEPGPPVDQPLNVSDSTLLGGKDTGSIYRTKKALDHYENMRQVHNNLSEHVHSSMKGPDIAPSTSTGRSHQPTNPSPLHTEQLPISPPQPRHSGTKWHPSPDKSHPHRFTRSHDDNDDSDEDGQGGVGQSSAGADDDDSLVFKMSELGGEMDTALSPLILFNRTQRLADSTTH